MLLIERGKPTKAKCCQCNRMYVPSANEMAEESRKPVPAFICGDCERAIELKFRELNRRRA